MYKQYMYLSMTFRKDTYEIVQKVIVGTHCHIAMCESQEI